MGFVMVNHAAELALPAPEMLAITYAPKVTAPLIRWLLLFDRRLDDVLARAKEPLIAQMRLAWWRDVLAKPAVERPKGEPLLALLADDPALLNAAQKLVDAAELLVGEPDDAQVKNASAQRALTIFSAYAKWTNSDPVMAEKLALAWAGQSDAVMVSIPRNLRPLSILALSALLEDGAVSPGFWGAGVRLSWHALTGR
jgi:15-cis-phytoene synthase